MELIISGEVNQTELFIRGEGRFIFNFAQVSSFSTSNLTFNGFAKLNISGLTTQQALRLNVENSTAVHIDRSQFVGTSFLSFRNPEITIDSSSFSNEFTISSNNAVELFEVNNCTFSPRGDTSMESYIMFNEGGVLNARIVGSHFSNIYSFSSGLLKFKGTTGLDRISVENCTFNLTQGTLFHFQNITDVQIFDSSFQDIDSFAIALNIGGFSTLLLKRNNFQRMRAQTMVTIVGSSAELSDLEVSGCSCDSIVAVQTNELIVERSLFIGNRVTGSIINAKTSSGNINESSFMFNNVSVYSAVAVFGGMTVSGTLFSGNNGGLGGAIFSSDSSPYLNIINCTFIENHSNLFGAVLTTSLSNQILNNTFHSNYAYQNSSGGSICFASQSAEPVVVNYVGGGNNGEHAFGYAFYVSNTLHIYNSTLNCDRIELASEAAWFNDYQGSFQSSTEGYIKSVSPLRYFNTSTFGGALTSFTLDSMDIPFPLKQLLFGEDPACQPTKREVVKVEGCLVNGGTGRNHLIRLEDFCIYPRLYFSYNPPTVSSVSFVGNNGTIAGTNFGSNVTKIRLIIVPDFEVQYFSAACGDLDATYSLFIFTVESVDAMVGMAYLEVDGQVSNFFDLRPQAATTTTPPSGTTVPPALLPSYSTFVLFYQNNIYIYLNDSVVGVAYKGTDLDLLKSNGKSNLYNLTITEGEIPSNGMTFDVKLQSQISPEGFGVVNQTDLSNNFDSKYCSLYPLILTLPVTFEPLANVAQVCGIPKALPIPIGLVPKLLEGITLSLNQTSTNNVSASTVLFSGMLDLAISLYRSNATTSIQSPNGITLRVASLEGLEPNDTVSFSEEVKKELNVPVQSFVMLQTFPVDLTRYIFPSAPESSVPSGEVIGISILDQDGNEIDVKNLVNPIEISFPYARQIDPERRDYICIWWDANAKFWNTDGCRYVERDLKASCLCNHLVSFNLVEEKN